MSAFLVVDTKIKSPEITKNTKNRRSRSPQGAMSLQHRSPDEIRVHGKVLRQHRPKSMRFIDPGFRFTPSRPLDYTLTEVGRHFVVSYATVSRALKRLEFEDE